MADPLSQSQIALVAQHLDDVGPEKPIGYLPLRTIVDLTGLNIQELAKKYRAKGLRTAFFTDECVIPGGAFYVYDSTVLAGILALARGQLAAHGWSSDPDQFVQALSKEWLSEDHALMPVIQHAFGD